MTSLKECISLLIGRDRTESNTVIQCLNKPRAIALLRVLCAAFLWLMACSDGQNVQITFEQEFDDLFAFGYLVLASGLAIVAISTSWWDFRLGPVAVAADVAVFTILPPFLEPISIGYFVATVILASLIITSVRLRFGRMPSWLAAALLNLLCFAICEFGHDPLMALTGHHFEPLVGLTSTLRTIYLMFVSLVLLGVLELRNPPSIGPFALDPMEPESPAITALIGVAQSVLGVSDVHLCSYVDGTGGFAVGSCRDGGVRKSVAGCQELVPLPGRATYMFDIRFDRHLALDACGSLRAGHGRASLDPLVLGSGIVSGAVSSLSVNGRPARLLVPMPINAGWDFLEVFEAFCVAVEVSLERYEHARSLLENELALERKSLSRDLHDTVAQSLAATRLWLESLRRDLPDGSPVATKINSLKDLLDSEHDHVRTIMRKLNDGPAPRPSGHPVNLGASLDNLKRLWRVEIRSNLEADPVALDRGASENVDLMLREAVSNAVRHGGASEIEVDLSADDSHIRLSISDNGTPNGLLQRPQNLASRVEAIGGSLELSRVNGQTLCMIGLPAA